MEQYTKKICDRCEQFNDVRQSVVSVFNGDLSWPTIFAHDGNLISYVNKKLEMMCKICSTPFKDCVFIMDGKYQTLLPYNQITVINCSIKKQLHCNKSIVMSTSLGMFILPIEPVGLPSLLFLRGIVCNATQDRRIHTIYYSHDRIFESSAQNLQQCAFNIFSDDDKNIYLIDNKGNTLEYETLQFICKDLKTTVYDVYNVIYANDKMQVKHIRYYNRIEILTDSLPVGRHTKPALRGADE